MILRSSKIFHFPSLFDFCCPKDFRNAYFSTARNHQHIPAKEKTGSMHPGRYIVFQSMMNAFTYYEQTACRLKHYGCKNPSLCCWMAPFHGHDVKLLGIAKFNTFACFWGHSMCCSRASTKNPANLARCKNTHLRPPNKKNKLQNLPSLQPTARP